MQLTGEFKRMSLIPIKKAVLDPRKGMLLRTYYINPQKFFDKVTKQKLERTMLYLMKLPDDINEFYKTKNIYSLKDRFNKHTWNSILKRNLKYKNLTNQYKLTNQKSQEIGLSILNYITTLDNSHLIKGKKEIKNLQFINSVSVNEKIKKAKRIKTKVKVKEQVEYQFPSEDPLQKLIDELKYDNSIIEREIILNEKKDLKLFGLRFSKLINLLNPTTSKLIQIFKMIMNIKELSDKNNYMKNIVFLPYHVKENKIFFTSLLAKLITEEEQLLLDGKELNSSVFIYHYLLLSQIDQELFKSLYLNFNNLKIKEFTEELKKDSFINLYSKYKNSEFELSLFLFYPKVEEIIKYCSLEQLKFTTRLNIFCYLSAREDINTSLMLRLFNLFFEDYNLKQSLINISESNPNILDLLYQVSFSKLLNLIYIPLEFIETTIPKQNYFTFTPITKILKISKLLNIQISDFIKNNRIKNKIECYLPLTNSPTFQDFISKKLLPLQVGYLNPEIENDYVKVTVSEYVKLDNNRVVFTPYNIID